MLRTLPINYPYVWRTAWVDLRYRYSGTGVGVFWNLVNPLLQVGIYSLVFPFFRQRGGYVLFLCAGLFPWQSFSEAVVRGSQALSRNAGLLRALPIAAETFVAQSALASLLGLLLTLAVLAPVALWQGAPFGPALVWVPLVAVLLHGLAFGLSLALAPLRVLFPDVSDALRALLQLWMWSMPIIYPEPALFERHPWLALLNPPYPFLRGLRGALLEGRHVEPLELAAMLAWVALSVGGGLLVARALRGSARDLL